MGSAGGLLTLALGVADAEASVASVPDALPVGLGECLSFGPFDFDDPALVDARAVGVSSEGRVEGFVFEWEGRGRDVFESDGRGRDVFESDGRGRDVFESDGRGRDVLDPDGS